MAGTFFSALAFCFAVMALVWPVVWLAERADRVWGMPGIIGTIAFGVSVIMAAAVTIAEQF